MSYSTVSSTVTISTHQPNSLEARRCSLGERTLHPYTCKVGRGLCGSGMLSDRPTSTPTTTIVSWSVVTKQKAFCAMMIDQQATYWALHETRIAGSGVEQGVAFLFLSCPAFFAKSNGTEGFNPVLYNDGTRFRFGPCVAKTKTASRPLPFQYVPSQYVPSQYLPSRYVPSQYVQ